MLKNGAASVISSSDTGGEGRLLTVFILWGGAFIQGGGGYSKHYGN